MLIKTKILSVSLLHYISRVSTATGAAAKGKCFREENFFVVLWSCPAGDAQPLTRDDR